MLKSPYRFPYNFTKDYLRWNHYRAAILHWYQRARYGVSEHDEFSLDYALARVLLQSIPRFKNDGKYGEFVIYTAMDAEYSMFDENGPEKDRLQQEAMDLWDMQLDAIWSALYDMYEDESENSIPYQYSTEGNERLTLAMTLFAENMRGLWW